MILKFVNIHHHHHGDLTFHGFLLTFIPIIYVSYILSVFLKKSITDDYSKKEFIMDLIIPLYGWFKLIIKKIC
jgi:hypothetical protein